MEERKREKKGERETERGLEENWKRLGVIILYSEKKNKCPKLTMKLSIAVEKAGQINGSAMKLCTEKNYSPVPNNRGGGGGSGRWPKYK